MAGTHWNRNSILLLIAVYNEQFEKLRNCGHTNTKIWGHISNKLNEKLKNGIKYNANQCKNKFAKLKTTSQKVKDARGPNNTGGKAVKFDYFEELNEIFCDSHSNSLPGAQSSLRPNEMSRYPEKNLRESEGSIHTIKRTNIPHTQVNQNLENNDEPEDHVDQPEDHVDDDPNFDVTDVLTPVPRKPKRKTISDQLKESVDGLLAMKKLQYEEKKQQIEQIIEIGKKPVYRYILEKLVDKI